MTGRAFRMHLARAVAGQQVLVQVTGPATVDLDGITVEVAFRPYRRAPWSMVECEPVTLSEVVE